MLLNFSSKSEIYHINVGYNYYNISDLCEGDTLRFEGDSLNGAIYGTISGYVYNSITSTYDFFNITSFTNIATTYDHILIAGDSSFNFQGMPIGLQFGHLSFNCTNSTEDLFESSEIAFYPNPCINEIFVSNSSKWNSIELLNSIGETVIFCNTLDDNFSISTQLIPNGFYFLKFEGINTIIRKLIVSH